MYAAYNTALGYEMQDSIDTALEWALWLRRNMYQSITPEPTT